MAFIELNDICKDYGTKETKITALNHISFTLEKNELVVILGASGAGKSTLLNILGGMDFATSGSYRVNGREITTLNEKEMALFRRNNVGFVFQFYNLVQNLTLRENVELATQICKKPLDIDETINLVGLKDRTYNFPSQLSGGEQQRVAIARALAKNPKLLLCDEPTGALDYQTGKQVLKVLQDTCKTQNKTVIVITHNLALTPMGDKVIKVRSGKIESITYNEHPMDVNDIEY